MLDERERERKKEKDREKEKREGGRERKVNKKKIGKNDIRQSRFGGGDLRLRPTYSSTHSNVTTHQKNR